MGLGNSKNKRSSYDVAAVVSNRDFTYEKHERPLPKVELPVKQEIMEASSGQEESPTNTATAVIAEIKAVEPPLIPNWVNEKNFKAMLIKTYPNIKEVTAFKACPAVAAGENFATLVLRIQINVELEDATLKNFSFMLKVPHETKEVQEMLQSLNFFTIENVMYDEVIPELEQMYREAGVEVKLAAKSYKLELEDKDIHYVLLEDLSVEAFKNANRLECLNMEHTLGVLSKMAQFHAASACRVAKKGLYPAIFTPDLGSEVVRAYLNQMLMSFKEPFLKNLKTYHNGEKYYDIMENFFDNLDELLVRSNAMPNGFCVLNHGDAWCNNILFKCSTDGQLEETVFVDYQNCRWGAPALDLYYFIFSSVQIDIKLSQFEYFVRYYHDSLTASLKLLEYPLEIPSLREFHTQMLNFGTMATMTSLLTLGVVLLDPTDSANSENFLGLSKESYGFKNAMYSNERYRKYINEILPWLYNRGFMEINLRDIDKNIELVDKLKELESQLATRGKTEIIEHSSSFYPEWVTESLFFNVVREDCKDVQKLLKFSVRQTATHLATLLQIDMDIELTDHTNRAVSYILKIPPNGDQANGVIPMLTAYEYEKESLAYSRIIPQLQNLYKEKAGLEVAFAPKSFKAEKGIDNALILENVQTKNFKNADLMEEGLDKKHIEAVLKRMAQFHAASACLFETSENVPDIYKEPKYTEENKKEWKHLTETYIETYLDCIKHYEGYEEYFGKLKNYASNALTLLTKASCIDENKFNVLNHGGCWTKNFLFQHDTRFGSPCWDLFHFLLLSPRLDLKLEYFDYFVRYYHENLKSSLELLGYSKPILSLKDLHQELLDNGVWALYTVLHILPIALMDPKDKLSLDKAAGNDEDSVAFRKQIATNKYYRSHIETILPWLDSKGFLDLQ